MSAGVNYSKEARPLLEEVTVQHRTLQRACSQKAVEVRVPVGITERKASRSGVAFSCPRLGMRTRQREVPGDLDE